MYIINVKNLKLLIKFINLKWLNQNRQLLYAFLLHLELLMSTPDLLDLILGTKAQKSLISLLDTKSILSFMFGCFNMF